MNAVDYTRKFRSVATVSWVGALVIVLGLAWLRIIPYNDYLPFTALLIGTVPILIFFKHNKAVFESCGGRMKISSGYPRIVYKCKQCGAEVNTRIHADY